MIPLSGSLVALVTPFKNGAVDLAALGGLVEWHLDQGTNGLCPLGTTGEAATLSPDDRATVLRSVLKIVRGRIPVVAGTGTNDTRTTIEFTRQAKELGADAALIVTPYYNKPPQEGLYLHYQAVTTAVDLPIVLYNVPGRTCVNMEAETTARIAQLKNVMAIKEACGNIEQIRKLKSLSDIPILSGDDAMTLPILEEGGVGVISVAANIIPSEIAALCTSYREGGRRQAGDLHRRWEPLFKGLFTETNPIPVKAALEMMGRCSAEVRLPLCAMSEGGRGKLRTLLASLNLVSA